MGMVADAATERQSSDVNSPPRDSLGRVNKGRLTPVGIFVDAYRAAYGEVPVMNEAAKKNLHNALRAYDPEDAINVVKEYLSVRDKFFSEKNHPAILFTTWLRQRMTAPLFKKTTAPKAVEPELIDQEFVGTPEEKARALAWARAHA